MKQQLAIFGIMLVMGIIAITANPAIAGDRMVYETKFAPYFVGRQQRDNLIVVNHFGLDAPHSLRVTAMAYDPFLGSSEPLDVQRAEIPAGEGARIVITDTYPDPHASRLIVMVEVLNGSRALAEEDGLSMDVIPGSPFSITRVLTTRKDATVLQINGNPILMQR